MSSIELCYKAELGNEKQTILSVRVYEIWPQFLTNVAKIMSIENQHQAKNVVLDLLSL